MMKKIRFLLPDGSPLDASRDYSVRFGRTSVVGAVMDRRGFMKVSVHRSCDPSGKSERFFLPPAQFPSLCEGQRSLVTGADYPQGGLTAGIEWWTTGFTGSARMHGKDNGVFF
ncbi:MAG: hypothetical protein HOP22_12090 [Nitrospiraceae bacterium]|jgi:hypothetical protein|nr:hypothetical protein [Nitrospiraceae bacterium]